VVNAAAAIDDVPERHDRLIAGTAACSPFQFSPTIPV
jgi:hypothetical protein